MTNKKPRRLSIRWTTNPANLGYHGTPTNLDNERDDARGVASTCWRAYQDFRQNIGGSTCTAMRAYYRGQPISRREFDSELDLCQDLEYQRYQERG